MIQYTWYETNSTKILLAGDESGLRYLLFEKSGMCQNGNAPQTHWTHNAQAFPKVREQLDEYFAGTRETFDVQLAPAGTDFQKRVWRELEEIPYGQTVSYADIATRIGSPKAVRAVGSANGKNPISIIIPCHRVIGSDGRLAGYGGGLSTKVKLLEREGLSVDTQQQVATSRSLVSVSSPV